MPERPSELNLEITLCIKLLQTTSAKTVDSTFNNAYNIMISMIFAYRNYACSVLYFCHHSLTFASDLSL